MAKVISTGKGRRWLHGGHPWLYADDVAAAEAQSGELAPVFDPNDNPLGWGLFSDASRIAVRMVTRSPEQPNRAFWAGLIDRAVSLRERAGLLAPGRACRLLGGDSERLPGFVVDRYADVLVIQSGCQGSDRMRDFLLELLLERLPFEPRAVLDRSDASVRRLEELGDRVEWIRGDPVQAVRVEQADGLIFEVDPTGGHKTGHYLDQRENRERAARLAQGGRVLDAFCYDGLFGIAAARAGASEVLAIDQSASAGEQVGRNAELNGVSGRVRFERANAMKDLRARAEAGERYDLVVIDPPAFARNRREAAGAGRGYRELNLRAIHLVEPGGYLVTASCSFAVGREAFMGFVSEAARDSRRDVYVEALHGAGADHPVLITLPESEYLKCAILRVC
ncbi:class I SAM-dependent rRNA methyltransferase [Engelhardtia mirabilis]|uniref:Ribosomal RNA large subunit methyltransferase I n=1 Tax=Engelhardtia mirabilis TaxID=2528011 RepID=A0A518BMT0_9BACT|nr:Ribosomal RNA large subunit methyltransferase I [Planctomycetes bacterium Pla133]QDV02572.1 Ribosomal RNA large subunit methyltransferase I [Planctomycetes bacterium Pla86]